jgi:hypothetical protein
MSQSRYRIQYTTPAGTYDAEASHSFVLPLLVRVGLAVVLHRVRHLVSGDGYTD